jgi:hypothetical protein
MAFPCASLAANSTFELRLTTIRYVSTVIGNENVNAIRIIFREMLVCVFMILLPASSDGSQWGLTFRIGPVAKSNIAPILGGRMPLAGGGKLLSGDLSGRILSLHGESAKKELRPASPRPEQSPRETTANRGSNSARLSVWVEVNRRGSECLSRELKKR